MRLREIVDLLSGEIVEGQDGAGQVEVQTCFAADLMSDVLAYSRPGALLVTGLASIQSVHTADVADLVAVAYVSGKRPAEKVLELARKRSIVLFTTPLSMLEACGLLHQAGITAARRI